MVTGIVGQGLSILDVLKRSTAAAAAEAADPAARAVANGTKTVS